MALIKNTGSYTVKIGVSFKNLEPGEQWYEKELTPIGDVVTIQPDIGSGAKNIEESDCRYVNAKHFKGKNDFYACAIADDGHVICSAIITAHQFWKFDGENLIEDESLSQSDCRKCHGS